MEVENSTVKTQFFLLGFSDHPELQSVLFAVFLSIYSVTLMGNLGMILLITASPPLHTPMYFFLRILSFVDACYSSVIAPKLLVDLVSEKKTISYNGCALYFFCCLVDTESSLLTVMAYDQYIAICNSLSIVQTTDMFHLSFYSSEINHFFCDISPVFSLSCTDTYIHDIVLVVFASLVEAPCLLTVLLSYILLITAILKTSSAEGRRKGFSTCAYHLTMVSLYHGTLIFIYLRPGNGHSMVIDKVISVFYTLIIPMLNALIYSLSNKDVKNAFRKMISRKFLS
uniref:G-protein coupled receptors family 1 profile domain-containing protein n=1 Tax=Capra hircus TaxID=9925 RepID=A0A8C2SG69_CAPHI